MDKDTRVLVRRMQREEDDETKARVERLQRALKAHGRRFRAHELTNIETAIASAVGRVAMDR